MIGFAGGVLWGLTFVGLVVAVVVAGRVRQQECDQVPSTSSPSCVNRLCRTGSYNSPRMCWGRRHRSIHESERPALVSAVTATKTNQKEFGDHYVQ